MRTPQRTLHNVGERLRRWCAPRLPGGAHSAHAHREMRTASAHHVTVVPAASHPVTWATTFTMSSHTKPDHIGMTRSCTHGFAISLLITSSVLRRPLRRDARSGDFGFITHRANRPVAGLEEGSLYWPSVTRGYLHAALVRVRIDALLFFALKGARPTDLAFSSRTGTVPMLFFLTCRSATDSWTVQPRSATAERGRRSKSLGMISRASYLPLPNRSHDASSAKRLGSASRDCAQLHRGGVDAGGRGE